MCQSERGFVDRKKSEGKMEKIGVLIRFCGTCAASSVASFSITR